MLGRMEATGEAALLDAATFVEVARAGSFRAAARALEVPTSTVSRRIARLEKALGTRLFLRSTRQVRPTDAAQRYLERVGPALGEIQQANDEARDHEGPLEGPLRITVPPDFGYGQLGVLVAEFARMHPKVRIDVDVSTRVVDLVGEGFDLAFRASRIDAASSLVARKLTPIELWLVASPAWAKAHARRLKHPRDLEEVSCVLFRPSGEVQRFEVSLGNEVIELLLRGSIAGSDFWLTRTCILESAGPGVMPSVVGRTDVAEGRLVRLFPDWTTPTSHAYVVHAQGRYLTARARAFRDFVLARLKG